MPLDADGDCDGTKAASVVITEATTKVASKSLKDKYEETKPRHVRRFRA